MTDWTPPPPKRSYQLTCRRKGWRSMETAPYDGTRVLLRCLDGEAGDRSARRFAQFGQWRDGGCFGGKAIDWYNDDGSWIEPDGWLPSPDVDEEESIEPEPRPISLKEFVGGDLVAMGCPVPWDLLKNSPVTVEDATELAFLLDVHVAMIQEIDRKYWAWVELEAVKQKAAEAFRSVQSFGQAKFDKGTDRIYDVFFGVDGDWMDEFDEEEAIEPVPMRPARRPLSLTDFCREELGPLWGCHDRHLDETAPVTDANATALAEMIGVSVDMIKAIDRNHRSWKATIG